MWPLERTKIWPTWPKSYSILNTHLISVHTKFELNCMNTFSNNGQKPQFSVILWPQEGQNLANMAKKWKFELDLVNTYLNNGQKPPFSVIVWPLEGQKLANMIPFSDLILNTQTISVHIKFELDYLNTFSDNGRKPWFSVILWLLEGQNLVNVAQKRINSEHTPNKCTHQVWFGLHEYFSRWRSETIIL